MKSQIVCLTAAALFLAAGGCSKPESQLAAPPEPELVAPKPQPPAKPKPSPQVIARVAALEAEVAKSQAKIDKAQETIDKARQELSESEDGGFGGPGRRGIGKSDADRKKETSSLESRIRFYENQVEKEEDVKKQYQQQIDQLRAPYE